MVRKDMNIWSLNNKIHREDGPAVQGWHENGQKWYESWWLNGEYHRENGIAYQMWWENGQKGHELWYLNNKYYYKREEWVEELLDIEKYNI